jgi:DNA polymerase-4
VNFPKGDGTIMRQRWILHADMDAFYASVEQRDNPELCGKPVIVGGSSNRGVVCAASYEARKFGVRSAMPIVEAKRRCSQGIFVIPNMHKYAEVSNQILKIFEDFSPIIETLSLDEAFLDITGMELIHSTVADIAGQIKERVRNELKLVVSVGVASNKFLAKLASALKKPDGLVVIHPGEELDLLAPLPVSKLWGVGGATEQILQSMQIDTIGRLRQCDPHTLERQLGKYALELYNMSWGRDDRPVVPDREAKSIGNEETFARDISEKAEIKTELLALAERVGWRLRKAGTVSKTITLKVRFASFKTVTRSCTLQESVFLDEVIYSIALQLMAKIAIKDGIRLLGITVSNLGQQEKQLSLFSETTDKQRRVAKVMDTLKDRFGKNIVQRGRLLPARDRTDGHH